MCGVDDGLACVSSPDSAGGLNLTIRVETSAVNFYSYWILANSLRGIKQMTSRSEFRGFLSHFVPTIISSRAFDPLSDQWGRQFYVLSRPL